MAIGTKANFVINNPFIYTGYTEMLMQYSDAFNAQSGGCIQLTSASSRGESTSETFFQDISGLVRRRDPTAVTTVTDKSLNMSEIKTVKLNRGVGPVSHTYDSFRKIGMGGNTVPESNQATGIDLLDMVVGQQTAKAVQVEQVNIVMKAAVTAMRNVAAIKHLDTATKITNIHLVRGLAKMGDAAANKIKLWVMHSKAFYDLVEAQITTAVDNVTGLVLATASPITLNRPVLVIDSPSLVITDGVSSGVDSYITLGLGTGAMMAEDSEDMMLATQLITGQENLAIRMQGEYSYNIGVHGFTWDLANGGVNPNDAAIATASNWDKAYADTKSLGGIVIESL